MITNKDIKKYITTSLDDERLGAIIQALLSSIKAETNNDLSRFETMPEYIVKGIADLIEWEEQNKGKLFLSSETISRHSQSFKSISLQMNYPKDLLSFIDPLYMARF